MKRGNCPTTDPTPVTVENFIRAETDLYFGAAVHKGGFGAFEHNREAMAIDAQTVVRINRTPYIPGLCSISMPAR